MDGAQYLARPALEALRGNRGWTARGDGLFFVGSVDALRSPCVAIVGTRAATAYGRRLARVFAADLSRAGCTIVSGLALGIDTAAHEGALDAAGATVGVLGGGHEHFFPRRNTALAERIVAGGGAVLSPYEPAVPAAPYRFLERNGVVAALSDAVVVIEAPERSGALNTAGWAADRIPVLAVPGDVDRRHVAGCHALIRDGAILARSANDVLEALALDRLPLLVPPCEAPRGEIEERLLRALAAGACDLDALVAATGEPPRAVLATLAILELDGRVEADATRYTLCMR